MMNISRQIVKTNDTRITALYERLSVDDSLDGTSNSIVNQQKILEDYATKNGFIHIRHFSDDGWSGTRWDRPAWQELIAEVEAGNVGVVICKDMSRIGRDYLQVGFYTEVMFRKHGVRFIAVSNNIDSNNKESAEFAPFLNLMSEWYARDCSRKVKTVLQAKGNSGTPLTNTPIYGYKRHPDNKSVWIIDEEAAIVVRRMFQMVVDGMSPCQIANTFRHEKIEKPSYYMVKLGMPGAKKNGYDYSAPYGWLECTIVRMLKRPEYLGHVVNFRTSRKSYKDKKAINLPENEWKVFENRHEAIIDQATFDMVQKLRGTPRRADSLGAPNPLTGLLFCYDCKAKMYNTRHANIDTKGFKGTDNYNCSAYTLALSKSVERCSGHYIRTDVVRELVLDSIKNICGYVQENQAEFIEKIREESVLHRGETAKSHKKTIAKNEKRIIELENLFRRTYEDNVNGKLNDTRFEQMTADYEREQAELEMQNVEMQAELDEFNTDSEKADGFIELVKRYTDFEELTTPMLNEFVNMIFIHKSEKNEWDERTQRIDIHFNFIGNFKVPIVEVEPTAEETEALMQRRIKLQKQREANKRFREKQKAKLEQEKAEKSA
jgi:DNA invertase Pin-like site-specific DNA recombinase